MGPLVQVEDVGDGVLLLDARWTPQPPPALERYRAAHLPGARFVDLDTDLAAPPGSGGRHPLPTAAAFQAAMRRLGVDSGASVVVYDDRDASVAARLWWMLRHWGHDDVRVLDGGIAAWIRAGRPTGSGDPVPVPPGDFTAGDARDDLLTVDEVPDFLKDGVLLDARLGPRFRGEVEPLDRVAGHIPGAVSAPTFDNSDPDGLFLPPAQLRDRFVALGVTGDRPVAAYCGSGVTAAHEVLALELAGFTPRLYAGSWSEWIADPDRPVATGP
ncbi:sulfurtransferase [Dactylosporangium maewongense]|uniref:Sulfurtransferase n=1 Tax=Dactylosporangium maewongense TaxID=634393 RepID=A0ABN1ZLI0_9ACTN